jgi:hypothetical protein
MEFFPGKVAKTLAQRTSSEQLENIATRKGEKSRENVKEIFTMEGNTLSSFYKIVFIVSGDIEAYVYSEEKTLAWLVKKANLAAKFLSEKGINSSEASVSSNFAKTAVPDSKK